MAGLAEQLELKKEVDLSAEFQKVKSLCPSCTDFERELVSLAFSIATGVGKTRLMGAFITWLFTEKGIRNFFVLAPNLTIYNKLIEDFGNPSHPKYVFAGISDFVYNRPIIITGDNYEQQGALFGNHEIRINIFNIAKFNSDTRGSSKAGVSLAPRIKRLSEYLGQSYWQYLSGLDDLVILMDEAHRYHADSSAKAINELKPILGLELTATPFDEKGKVFKNIVYEYSLAKALTEGKYVKNPAIARRKNFDPKGLDERQIEIIKLEDAISIHQDTKTELETYARNEQKKLVKPFILVVCKDTTHAREIFELIESDEFYDGEYKGKVLQIDSTTKKDGGIEEQFLTLEHPDNQIEIVIHVNMLKEGWDVTSLYTIVPLRAANAAVLVEQTIGRGLRLPFDGKRTGVDKIDKLTIVAHENFDAVVQAAAQDPSSVLNKLIEKIYGQMKAHFTISQPDYIPPQVLPFTKIEPWNFAVLVQSGYRDYRDVVQPTSAIPRYVFRGFEKACHFEYKFDSKTEQDLAFILENDKSVLKWLRPAPSQFRIYWDNNSKRYEPDFIAETKESIYMIETKMASQLNDEDVLMKKAAAEKYCKHANKFIAIHGGKTWKYVIVPHDAVSRTTGLNFLIAQFD